MGAEEAAPGVRGVRLSGQGSVRPQPHSGACRGLRGFLAQGNAGLVWLGVFSFVVVFLFCCLLAPLAAPSERPAAHSALGAGVPAGWGRGMLGGPACNPLQNSSCFGVSLPGLWQLFQPPAGALLLAPPLAQSFC